MFVVHVIEQYAPTDMRVVVFTRVLFVSGNGLNADDTLFPMVFFTCFLPVLTYGVIG